MNLKVGVVRRFEFRAEEAQRSAAREAITSGAVITTSYLAMNAAATLLAGFGLLQNSPAVIIGAMLVAMLLGPIVGIALRYHEDKQETWLTGEQVEDLLAALDGYPDQSAADAIRLLIVTGVHEGEVLGA